MATGLDVTDIIIRPNNKNPQAKIKAYANITFNDILDVNVKLIEGKNGLFLGLPNHKAQDGTWFDDVRLKTNEDRSHAGDKFKRELLAAVVQKWNEGRPEGGDFNQTQTQPSQAAGSGSGTARDTGFNSADEVPF